MARQHGTTRLYVAADLENGAQIELAADQARYLAAVLRSRAGDELALFNGRDGEWRGHIVTLSPRHGAIAIAAQTLVQPDSGIAGDIWLAFASVKRPAAELIVRTATELGVMRIQPVATKRARPGAVKLERLRNIAIAAAEQCGRLTVPKLDDVSEFADLLEKWPADRLLLVADESGAGTPLAGLDGSRWKKWGLLIGPEGGFVETELDAVRQTANLSLIDLGPRIMRADTAAAAGLAVLQSRHGDWRR